MTAMSRSQRLLARFFAFAGVMHFIQPRAYEAIMPPWVPLHREAVQVSGIAEIVGPPRACAPTASRRSCCGPGCRCRG
jgi:uncharacterized membrane protein